MWRGRGEARGTAIEARRKEHDQEDIGDGREGIGTMVFKIFALVGPGATCSSAPREQLFESFCSLSYL